VKDEGLSSTREEAPCLAREHRRFGERFAVEALVGSVGMGMVFRARDEVDGQAVALKVLHRQGPLANEKPKPLRG
jgi:serine/threonine protein kinase